MKSASLFEIVAARGWNVLNEGKTFTPVFVLSVFLIANGFALNWLAFGRTVLFTLPLFIVYYLYDYPLHLRWWLWPPLIGFVALFGGWNPGLWLWAFGLYAFFTVFFWGTLYYHLRIGTTWWNFTRIWKLFLKNTDSTSGNVFEQLPKVFLQLAVLDWGYGTSAWTSLLPSYISYMIALAFYSWLIHKLLFTWKPQEYPAYTRNSSFTANPSPAVDSFTADSPAKPLAKRVVVIVIDGCRKERLEQADTPFLDRMRAGGVYYNQMETVYPARTVVCFSSMFTGTYPREHGIRSNMVWKLGVQAESIFDTLQQQGRKGVMFGCAHLIDAFGEFVESYTAVQNNEIVDHNIMARAKQIMRQENPDLMVIQMISVDQTGHSRGVWYEEYLQKIHESDLLIQDFYEWMGKEGLLDDTVLVVMADHGQGDGIGGHGHLDEGERFVPFLMHGPAIQQGMTVDEPRSIVSLAPTIAQLLGVPIPEKARGPVLTEALRSAQTRTGESGALQALLAAEGEITA